MFQRSILYYISCLLLTELSWAQSSNPWDREFGVKVKDLWMMKICFQNDIKLNEKINKFVHCCVLFNLLYTAYLFILKHPIRMDVQNNLSSN